MKRTQNPNLIQNNWSSRVQKEKKTMSVIESAYVIIFVVVQNANHILHYSSETKKKTVNCAICENRDL